MRGDPCERCKRHRRVDGERYCRRCRDTIWKGMHRDGYLQPTVAVAHELDGPDVDDQQTQKALSPTDRRQLGARRISA